MQSLEGATQETDDTFNTVGNQNWTTEQQEESPSEPLSPKRSLGEASCPSPTKKIPTVPEQFDIFEKLTELHRELSLEVPGYLNLKPQSFLLEKLVIRERLHTMIVNLYPGNKGYSFAFRLPKPGDNAESSAPSHVAPDFASDPSEMFETNKWLYEEDALLRYIDNEELPMIIVDLVEQHYHNLYYSGCIIAEVRDYRTCYPLPVCETTYVLLKPTMQSLFTDVNQLTHEENWSVDEKLALESELIRIAAPPLCLDPNPSIGEKACLAQHAPYMFNTPPIQRQARKYSQVAINRKRKLDQITQYHGPELCDFLARHRYNNRIIQNSPNSSKYPKKPSEIPKPNTVPCLETPELSTPMNLRFSELEQYAKAYRRPEYVNEWEPQLIEYYILEADQIILENPKSNKGQQDLDVKPIVKERKVNHIKLSIFKRPPNSEFIGELYVDLDYKPNEVKGASCRFSLGTRDYATRYIEQFTEIFTEEGRKSVRMRHVIPGQQEATTCTAKMKDRGKTQVVQKVSSQFSALVSGNSNHQCTSHTMQALTNSTVIMPQTPQCVNTTDINALPGASTNNPFMNNIKNKNSELNNDIARSNIVNQFLCGLANSVNVTANNRVGANINSSGQLSNGSANKTSAINMNQNSVNTSVPLFAILPPQPNAPPTHAKMYAPVQLSQSSPVIQQTQALSPVIQQTQKAEKTIRERLQALYRELSQACAAKNNSFVLDTSYLLEQLVAQDRLDTLVFNFHPDSVGPSIATRVEGLASDLAGTEFNVAEHISRQPPMKTIRWQSEEDLLQCLAKEEMTQLIAKLVVHKFPHLLYNNYVIAEVRDYRESFLKPRYILLKLPNININPVEDTDWESSSSNTSEQSKNVLVKSRQLQNRGYTQVQVPPLQQVQQPQIVQTAADVGPAQQQTQTNAINAISNSLSNFAQQFEQAAAAKSAKFASASKSITVAPASSATAVKSSNGHAAMLSLLNRAPAAMTNNANITNSTHNNTAQLLHQTINQELQNRKTLGNQPTVTRVLNSNALPGSAHNLNSNYTLQHHVHVTLSALASQLSSAPINVSASQNNPTHTYTLTSMNNSFSPQSLANTSVPISKSSNNHTGRVMTNSVPNMRRISSSPGSVNSDSNASSVSSNLNLTMPTLSALVASSPTSDTSSSNTSNPALIERLMVTNPKTPSPQFRAPSPKNIQHYQVHSPSPKPNPVMSPLPSPPQTIAPQQTQPTTLRLQGLNLESLQNAMASFQGLQNVQVQIPGMPAPISLSLSSGTQAGLIMSVPMSTNNMAAGTATMVQQINPASSLITNNVNPQTVMLSTTQAGTLAQLVASGVKGIGINQQNMRTATNRSVAPIQLVGAMQRPRGRTITPVTAKQLTASKQQQLPLLNSAFNMGTTTIGSAPQMASSSIASNSVLTLTPQQQQQLQMKLQKQAQLQQCLSQQQQQKSMINNSPGLPGLQGLAGKQRRRSNTAESNK